MSLRGSSLRTVGGGPLAIEWLYGVPAEPVRQRPLVLSVALVGLLRSGSPRVAFGARAVKHKGGEKVAPLVYPRGSSALTERPLEISLDDRGRARPSHQLLPTCGCPSG